MNDTPTISTNSFWKRLGAIVSLLVAIGAYSGDSIMVKLVKSDDVYSVVSSGEITEKNRYYALYYTEAKPRLVPISMLVYLKIRNDSNQDQIVESVSYEVMNENEEWLAADCVAIDREVFAVEKNDFQHAIKANFDTNNLLKNLGQGVIKPKQIVSGWLLVKYPDGIQDSLIYRGRIHLHSGFGESEQHDVSGVFNAGKETSTKLATVYFVLTGQRDLSKIPLDMLNDN